MLLPALQTVVAGLIRRTWLVAVLAVIACSAFAARAVAAFVGAASNVLRARLTVPGEAPTQPGQPHPSTAGPFAARIPKGSDAVYDVDRALVRELVSGAARPHGARAVPVMDDGEVKGIRLYGV